MTLYFLDHAKTSTEHPYPRVVRVEGEPSTIENITLPPGRKAPGTQSKRRSTRTNRRWREAFELSRTRRPSHRRRTCHRHRQQRTCHQHPLRSTRPRRRQILPNSSRRHHAGQVPTRAAGKNRTRVFARPLPTRSARSLPRRQLGSAVAPSKCSRMQIQKSPEQSITTHCLERAIPIGVVSLRSSSPQRFRSESFRARSTFHSQRQH